MVNKLIYLFILIISILFPQINDQNSTDAILINVINRLEGINQSMVISSEIFKNEKMIEQEVISLYIHWPLDGEIKKMVYIEYKKPEKKKEVKFWEHFFKINQQSKRWMTLPVTGKLRDISEKKYKKNRFNLSDLQLKKSDIENHHSKIIGMDKLNGRDIYIIESIEKKNKLRKIIKVDKESYFIWGIETINKNGKTVKLISCEGLKFINEIPILTSIKVLTKKGNKNINIKLEEIKFDPDFNLKIFNPIGKN